jgi:hypothetical protein
VRYEIPSLRPDRLSTTIPNTTYAGGPVRDPEQTLFLWRSCATEKAIEGALAFFLDDARLEPLWKAPARYAKQFAQCGIKAVVEVDFSLWVDSQLAEQQHNVFRTRTVSRVFQAYGLNVIPNLNWSNERSFPFCFAGIPVGAPVCMTECRTPGGTDDDRRAFLVGLEQGVKQVQPRHIIVYGGQEHAYWLQGNLPQGPTYTLLTSWTTERRRVRATQERQVRERNQLTLFGGNTWAVEEVQAA